MTYNPEEVSYQQLVDLFYKGHDATTLNRQKGDAGTQYRSGIYTHDQSQLQVCAGRLRPLAAPRARCRRITGLMALIFPCSVMRLLCCSYV